MVYLISDTHFGDNEKGIISFENRPFKDRYDMIESLIKNWNKTVSESDDVYHLGDVFSGLDDETRKTIISRLNGHKYLVLGNHDRDKDTSYWRELGFTEVYDKPVILNNFVILSHEPLYMTLGPYVNAFGHVHGNRIYKDYCETAFCVCVEREYINYTPISLEKCLSLVQSCRE